MTEDISIQFAKEILGWENAFTKEGHRCYYGQVYKSEETHTRLALRCYDIPQILRFVKWYCNKVGTRIDLNVLYELKPAEALMRECLKLKRILENKIGT